MAPRSGFLTAALAAAVVLVGGSFDHQPWAASEGPQTAGAQPVVVELFTSQGCSSCPPADALLGELAMRQDIVALSLHVDYWDYIGWKDTFASPITTARQRAYAQALRSRYVYTPQMVIDGQFDVVGSRRNEVRDLIAKAARQGKTLDIRFETEDGGRIVIPAGRAPEGGATVWLAVYDGLQETKVERGENRGRSLRYHHVVRELEELGTWTGEELVIPLDLAAAEAAGRAGCAVFVQQGRAGRILGAAKMELGS